MAGQGKCLLVCLLVLCAQQGTLMWSKNRARIAWHNHGWCAGFARQSFLQNKFVGKKLWVSMRRCHHAQGIHLHN